MCLTPRTSRRSSKRSRRLAWIFSAGTLQASGYGARLLRKASMAEDDNVHDATADILRKIQAGHCSFSR